MNGLGFRRTSWAEDGPRIARRPRMGFGYPRDRRHPRLSMAAWGGASA
jgi:hypothetical protein